MLVNGLSCLLLARIFSPFSFVERGMHGSALHSEEYESLRKDYDVAWRRLSLAVSRLQGIADDVGTADLSRTDADLAVLFAERDYRAARNALAELLLDALDERLAVTA